MKQIWAPWRGEYITDSIDENKGGCIFCKLAASTPSKENLIVYSNKKSFVVMNKFPYNNGHIMVVPKMHVDVFDKLPGDEYIDLSNLLKISIRVIYDVYSPQGCNVGLNIGRAAGSGLDSHIHYHVVPRWNGDTNFMPVFGDVKVISEHILSTYDKLYKGFLEVSE